MIAPASPVKRGITDVLAGAFLVLSGLIGLAFRKKSEDAPSVKPTISLRPSDVASVFCPAYTGKPAGVAC